jgi:5'-3' exonuclease
MSILCVDFMNQCHRARSGFQAGPAPVVFNFFRQFKALVDEFKPNRVYVVLEGRPVQRYELLPEYKATRKVEESDPKYVELQRFFDQKKQIVNLLSNYFPVSVVRHPTSECDDTIYNLIKYSSTAIPWTVVSNDSDFTQLIQEYSHIKVWNPIKKEFLTAPSDYDYVTWKSLRGDKSDNIPGIPGIGDKIATKIASDHIELAEFLSNSDNATQFQRNYDLISFRRWTNEEAMEMTSSTPTAQWSDIKSVFSDYGFKSIVSDDAWPRFIDSFEHLWGQSV